MWGWGWGSLQRQDLKKCEVWPCLRYSHLLQGNVCGAVASAHMGQSDETEQFYTVQIFHPPGRPVLINRTVTQICSQTVALTRHKSGGWLRKKGGETHTGTTTIKHLLCQQRRHRQESGTLLRDLLEEGKKKGAWMDTLCSLSGLDPLWVSLL